MQEYERSQKISAQAHEVFAWLSHVGNLPSICPRDRRLHRRTVCRGRFGTADPDDASVPRERGGYLRCRGLPRRGRGRPQDGVGRRGLPGLLGLARGRSRLRRGERDHRAPQLRLAFGRAGDEGAAAPGLATTPWRRTLSATLESIRRHIEEGAGKVEPPPPAEPRRRPARTRPRLTRTPEARRGVTAAPRDRRRVRLTQAARPGSRPDDRAPGRAGAARRRLPGGGLARSCPR